MLWFGWIFCHLNIVCLFDHKKSNWNQIEMCFKHVRAVKLWKNVWYVLSTLQIFTHCGLVRNISAVINMGSLDIVLVQMCKQWSRFSLVGARGVDTHSFILTFWGGGDAFVGVVEAAQTRVAGWAGADVMTTRKSAARSAVGTGAWQAAVLILASWS